MTDKPDELEARLRAMLTHRADQAPAGDPAADRILADTAASPRSRRRTTWMMPLLAAASVAAVIGSVLSLSHVHHSPQAGPTPGVQPSSQTYSTQQTPAPRRTTPQHTASATRATSRPAGGGNGVYRDPNHVTGFRVIDLTFVQYGEAWALGSADCQSGAGTCVALFHTTGTGPWTSMPVHGLNVAGDSTPCANNCVDRIRFANSQDGYAYNSAGNAPLYTTTDGGQNWNPQAGNTVALETLDNNVLRVVESGADCTGPCAVHVQVADIGSTGWKTVPLPGGAVDADSVQLVRANGAAYLLAARNVAKGQASTVYASTDSGEHWTDRGDPCSRAVRGSVTESIAAGTDDALAMLCATGGAHPTSAVSHDAAAHVTAGGTVPGGPTTIVGDPATELVAAGGDGAYRSTDGGRSWHRIAALSGSVEFVGFQSTQTGRAVTDGGRVLLTTQNGGADWSALRFS